MGTINRGYPELPVNVTPDVPHYVNLALKAVDADVAIQALRLGIVAETVDEKLDGKDLVYSEDTRVPVLTEGGFLHAWGDPSGALSLYDRPSGEVVAPLGVETPYAGLPTPADMPYLWVPVFDVETGTYPELVLGPDGCVPQDRLERWRSRMGLDWVVNGGGGGVVGTRTAGVALTLSAGTTVVDTRTAVHLRLPFRIAASARRFRVHIRNYNDRSNLAYSGSLAVTGLWGGRHAGGGTFAAAPVKLAGGFTTAADGGEYVSGWIERTALPLDAYGEYLFSLGYTCAAQTNHAGQGGSWQSSAPGQAGDLNPGTALERSQTAPLDIWVETELPANVPVGAFVGDSLTCGTGADLPVYESYGAKHALAHGYVPQIMANHGSQMTDWTNRSQWKWQKYAGLSKPDSVLWAVGGNDVFSGADLPTLQTRFAALARTIRAELGGHIYLANIMPRNRGTADPLEVSRRAYNAWLAGLPERAVNVFDFAVTVAKPTAAGYMEDAYNCGDNVHLNTAGYARNAAAITAPLAVIR